MFGRTEGDGHDPLRVARPVRRRRGAQAIAFARGSRRRDGFGWLDKDGRINPDCPVETYITAQTTYAFCLAQLLGDDGVIELIDHGLTSMSTVLHDEQFGGWFHSTRRHDRKEAHGHAFVVLAAATAVTTGRRGARARLDDALECVERRFWDQQAGLSLDVWDRRWSTPEAYCGANANMHLVEALLAASAATGDPDWRLHALRERELHKRVALVGFDDIMLGDLLDPGITVVAQDPQRIGELAAKSALATMQGEDLPPETIIVPTTPIPRGSGGMPPYVD